MVQAELTRPRIPAAVREWLLSDPEWLELRQNSPATVLLPAKLGKGERTAIALAQSAGASLILIDDRAGAAAARAQGLDATGTLGVPTRGAARGLVDLPTALTRLRTTNFRYRSELLDGLLARHRG